MRGINSTYTMLLNFDGSITLRLFTMIGAGTLDLQFKNKAEYLNTIADEGHKKDAEALLSSLEL